MSRVSQEMRNFAKRLINSEAKGSISDNDTASDAFDVCEKLRPQLVTLLGNGGFWALLSRALALGGAEIPWLRAAHVKPDGGLGGFEQLATPPDLDKLFEGRVVLLAHLLALLVAFIGENLTLSLVREAWPKAALADLKLSKGDKNEKT